MKLATFSIVAAYLCYAASPLQAGVIIDDFSEGTSFETLYSQGFKSVQNGLSPELVLGGERRAVFHTVSGVGASARAALNTTTGELSLDSVQGGNLGGGGLELRYGNHFDGGPDLNFDLTKFADQRLEVEIEKLTAGNTKGVRTKIDWQINLHSIDLLEVVPGQPVLVNQFTNVSRQIDNTSTRYTASIPVSALLMGSANEADLVGILFTFQPLGDGGGITIHSIRLIPEPSTLVILAFVCGMALMARCRSSKDD